MNQISIQTSKSMLSPENFEHYYRVAKMMAASDMVPKAYKGSPQNVLVAMEFGASLGLVPLAAVQNIAVINGRPALYGDALLAVVQGNPDYEWIKETMEKDNSGEKTAVCIIKRKNHDEHRVEFSVADAKKASLWGKQGPWSQFPDRMLMMRARAFAIRNLFADALFGIRVVEEVQDYRETRNITPVNAKVELKALIDRNKKKVDNEPQVDPETGEVLPEELQ